jgi:hypothetical protein
MFQEVRTWGIAVHGFMSRTAITHGQLKAISNNTKVGTAHTNSTVIEHEDDETDDEYKYLQESYQK